MEVFGMAVCEAMYYGLTVIFSQISDIPELIEDGKGLLTESTRI